MTLGDHCASRWKLDAAQQEHRLGKTLHIGNPPFYCTEADLKDLFGRHGYVGSVDVITDGGTGRARGFGFPEMEEANTPDVAMRALDGSDLGGRAIQLNEAHDRRGADIQAEIEWLRAENAELRKGLQ